VAVEHHDPSAYFDMKLQVFIHGIDVVEDVLHYPGDDSHCICVMKITLKSHSKYMHDVKEQNHTEGDTLQLKTGLRSPYPYLHGVCFTR